VCHCPEWKQRGDGLATKYVAQKVAHHGNAEDQEKAQEEKEARLASQ
jgi:hypothetical protein